MTATIEYAVRHTAPGADPVTVPVGDQSLMDQTVAEFLDEGHQAMPVTRLVTSWAVDQGALTRIEKDRTRQEVIDIGFGVWEHEGADPVVAQALADLCAYDREMPADRRAELLAQLVDEIDKLERIEDIEPGPGEDRQSLLTNFEAMINEAADALIGGAS